MRRSLTFTSVLIILLAVGAEAGDGPYGPAPLVRQKSPRIEIARPEHDWGQAQQGSSYTHEFVISNTGDDTLAILKVKSGCDCASASADETIPPGATGIVRFTVDTKRLRGDVRKSASIYTNDPENPKVKVTLVGKVVTHVVTDPVDLELSALAGQSKELEVILSPGTDAPLSIHSIKTRYSNATIQGPEPLADGRRFRIKIRMKPRFKPGTKRDTLYFTLLDSEGKKHREQVPLVIEHRDPISIEPSRTVSFSRSETAQLVAGEVEAIEREVFFRRTEEGGPFSISKVEVGKLAEWVTAAAEPLPDGSGYRIVIRLQGYRKDRPGISGRLIVHTDRPEEPTRKLFLSAAWRM